jgi:hypothetical protein
MTDKEQDVRRALRNMLDSIEPAPPCIPGPSAARRQGARRLPRWRVCSSITDAAQGMLASSE